MSHAPRPPTGNGGGQDVILALRAIFAGLADPRSHRTEPSRRRVDPSVVQDLHTVLAAT
jgi:hypothetical protein